MEKKNSVAAKALSVFLSLVMCLSVCLCALTVFTPKAEAATAGNYYYRVRVNSSNDTGGWDKGNWTVYGKNNNGSGSETSIATFSQNINFKENGRIVKSGSSSCFPTKVTFNYSFGGGVTHRKMDAYIYLDVSSDNSTWTEIGSVQSYSYEWGTNSGTKTLTVAASKYPKVNSISISGGSTELTAPDPDNTGVNYTSAFTASVKDQYGVVWGQTSVSWSKNSISNTTTYLSATSGDSSKFGVSRFTAASAKATGTITASCTGNGVTKSASKSITVYPTYKVTFNGNNGTLSGTSTQYPVNKTTSSTISFTIPSGFSASRSGWTFLGFSTSASSTSGTKAGLSLNISSVSQTLYANWSRVITNTYFYYNASGELKSTTKSATAYNSDSTKSVATPASGDVTTEFSKDGKTWTLKGWNAESTTAATYGGATATASLGFSSSVAPSTSSSAHCYYPAYALKSTNFSANYNYYADGATTYSVVNAAGTASGDSTAASVTKPASIPEYRTIKDKAFKLNGWSTSSNPTSSAYAYSSSSHSISVPGAGTPTSTANKTPVELYPYYTHYSTKFYANYNYITAVNETGEVSSSSIQKSTTALATASTGAMPVPTADEIPMVYADARTGTGYIIVGWSTTPQATPFALDETATVQYPASAATAAVAVPDTASGTNDNNLTPVELYPVYQEYSKVIYGDFRYYNASGSELVLTKYTNAVQSATADFNVPAASEIPASYTKDGVTYTLKGWALESSSSTSYTAVGGTINMTVKADPTIHYNFFPVYECTTTAKYVVFNNSGAQQTITKTTTLYKTDASTPAEASLEVPVLAAANKTLTLDGRTFTFCGWRTDKTSANSTVAADATSQTLAVKDTAYTYYAIYKNGSLTLSYGGINGTPVPASQTATQYINAGIASTANINNASAYSFTINPSDVTPVKTGYTFIGWQLANNAETETAAYGKTGGSYSAKVNTTLYAVYSINNVAVKFHYWDSAANAFKTDTVNIKYDDKTRSDSGAARYTATSRYLDTSVIDHADGTNHYFFLKWVLSDGSATLSQPASGSTKAAQIKFAVTDVNVQAQYRAVGHTWVLDRVISQATCTADGEYVRHCSVCGYVDSHAATPATGHQNAYAGYRAPSCDKTGTYATAFCGICDSDVMTADGTRIQYFDFIDGEYVPVDSADGIIPALGHDYYLAETVTPTCFSHGYDLYVCSRNEAHTYKDYQEGNEAYAVLEHTLKTEPAAAATCTANGHSEYTVCTVCGFVVTDQTVIPATGHSLTRVPYVASSCTEEGHIAYYVCDVCGGMFLNHLATQTATVESVVIPTPNNGEHLWVYKDAEPATCLKDGHSAGYVCECCGIAQEGGMVTETAAGHDWNAGVYTASAVPCVEPGYTTYTCLVCGETNIVEDALAEHDYQLVEAVEASCEADGYAEHYACSVCGKAQDAYEIIPATGHNYVETAPATDATCGSAGVTAVMTCEKCGDVKGGEEIPALAHTYTRWIKTASEDCENGDEWTAYCIYCATSKTESRNAAKGHDYVHVDAKPATCIEDGITEGSVCSVCGKAEYGAEVITAGGHNYEVVSSAAATCSAEGETVKKCSYCGDTITETVAKLAHTPETIPGKAATCLETGLTDGVKCSVCDEIITAQTETGLGAHDYASVVTAPGCETAGFTTHACTVCGDSYTDSSVKATGHSFGSWTNYESETGYKMSTCTEDGYRTRYCANCDATEVKTLLKLGHKLIAVSGKAPTCVKEGRTAYWYCERCGIKYADKNATELLPEDFSEVIPANGHNYVTDVVAPGCTTKGYTVTQCLTCGDTKVTDYVDPIGHIGGEATCASYPICERCGQPYETELSPHYYVVDFVDEGSCTSRKATYYICEVCGDRYTEYGETLAHKPTEESTDYTAPTCTAAGHKTVFCSECGETLEDYDIPALGHTDTDGDGRCDTCGTAVGNPSGGNDDHGGSESGACDLCGMNHGDKVGKLLGRDGFICKIVQFLKRIVALFKG